MRNTRRGQCWKLAVINLALAAAPWHALAQSAPAASVQYAIAAGPLDTVLNRYAEQAGVALSYDPAYTRGLHSKGLQGSMPVDAAFGEILAATGLQAVRTADKRYTLLRGAQQAGPVQLDAVTVTGARVPQPTEGTGSIVQGAKPSRQVDQSCAPSGTAVASSP